MVEFKKHGIFTVLFIGSLLFQSSKSIAQNNPGINYIEFEVRDKESGNEIAMAKIEIIFESGKTVKFQTDSFGKASYYLDTSWHFKVLVSKSGYLSAKGFEMNPRPDSNLVIFHLYELQKQRTSCSIAPLVYFNWGSSDYLVENDSTLQIFTDVIRDNPSITWGIIGHVNYGEDTTLAHIRAQKVLARLIEMGVPRYKMIATGEPLNYVFKRKSLKNKSQQEITNLLKENQCVQFTIHSF